MEAERGNGGPVVGPRRRHRRSWGPLALGLVGPLVIAALFAWEVRVAAPATIDDAYITFSFSRNVALGHGPVYGHREVVEGYSNFLWMMVMAAGLAVRPAADPAVLARWLALPFVALLAFSTYRLGREKVGMVLALAAAALTIVNADSVMAFQIGLETLPHTALLTLGFWLYARSLSRPELAPLVVPAFVGVGLMRIDGFVPLAFILGFEAARRAWRTRHGKSSWAGLRAYALWAGPGVLVYLLWFAWRWHTYGLPLPSTYYAKALLPKVMPRRGWQYVRDEMQASGTFLVLPFAAVLLARRKAPAVAMVLFVLGQILYVIKVGGDWMPYGRFLLPVFPLLLVIALWGGAELAEMLTVADRPRWVVLLVGTGAPLLLLGFLALRTESHLIGSPLQRQKAAIAREQFVHVQRLKEAAGMLAPVLPPGARLVTDYGGVLAYYTDAAPIEMWGLCNATIATRGGLEGVQPIYGRTCPECYPELDPEFFHVMVPLVRPLDALHTHDEVVRQVWQTDTIGRYMNFATNFVAGRIMNRARNQALYFLQRRRPGSVFRAHAVSATLTVDYPFEPGGRAPGV